MGNEPVTLHTVLLCLIAAFTIIAFLPSAKTASWPPIRYLPLLSVPLYVVYEATMPIAINIRIDLILIYPMLYKCVKSAYQAYCRQDSGPNQT